MRKILIFANNAGGLYNFRFELIKELIKQGDEVYFCLPESSEDLKVQLMIDIGAKHIKTCINRRGKNPFEDLKLINEYKKTVKKVNPDVILTYTIKPNIYGAYVASLFKIPVLMNVTGIGTSLTNSRLKKIVIQLYKNACSKATIIFFQNESNRALFLRNKMVDINKTILLPGSGVNISRFKPMDIVETATDKTIKFLFIGRLMREKGLREYLEAAKKITLKNENIEFLILGPFEEQEYKEILANNMNSRIKYLGVSNDVRNEMKEVDCIVNPSYHEGMSNVLLEGAAMGKPLIASNIPGCKEIIEDGYNGLLFEVKSVESLEDKLIQFIELDSREKRKMGQNSRKKVENEFDRNIILYEYMKAIKKIVNR